MRPVIDAWAQMIAAARAAGVPVIYTTPVSARYRASGWRFERDRPAPAVREGRSGATPRACRRAACARRSPSAKNHSANWPRQEVTDGAGR